MKPMKTYKPTPFMAKDSTYDKDKADRAVQFIQSLRHTKGVWAGKPFLLLPWQERIIRDLFGIVKADGYRQFNTAYIEIPKKNGKSELAAAVALLLTCADFEERAEVYGCAADRQQASIVFEVAADMVRMCPSLNRRVKILAATKRIVYLPTNSFYQVLSAEAYSKHGFNVHAVVFDELEVLLAVPVQDHAERPGSAVDVRVLERRLVLRVPDDRHEPSVPAGARSGRRGLEVGGGVPALLAARDQLPGVEALEHELGRGRHLVGRATGGEARGGV